MQHLFGTPITKQELIQQRMYWELLLAGSVGLHPRVLQTGLTSHFGEMLEELQRPELQERRQQASLPLLYKTHNNLVTIDKNRYLGNLTKAGRGNRSTRSHSYQNCILVIHLNENHSPGTVIRKVSPFSIIVWMLTQTDWNFHSSPWQL